MPDGTKQSVRIDVRGQNVSDAALNTPEVVEDILEEVSEVVIESGKASVPDKGFSSFDKLKDYLGSPGEGNAWHHIVEQSQIGKSGFSSTKVNNVKNIIAIPHGKGSVHAQISGFYSSKPDFTNGLTVRQWLSGKSFDEQFDYGMKILKKYGSLFRLKNNFRKEDVW